MLKKFNGREKRSCFPVTAVGVLLVNPEGKILLGKRKEKFGQGMYGLPGGQVEKVELFFEAGSREVEEETGIKKDSITIEKFISVSYERIFEKDGLTVGVIAYTSEEPEDVNDEIGDWSWYSIDSLPENLFPPSERIIDNYKKGIIKNTELSW